jgi:RNA polymerase sigma-70 factor (ECF subfamily)
MAIRMAAEDTAEDRAKSLCERAQRGERAAFDELVRGYEPRLRRLVEARLGGKLRESLEADDLLQEALLRAFRSLGGFEWRRDDAFVAWFGGIVEHVIRSAAEKCARHEVIELVSDVAAEQSSPSQRARREERFARLERALEALSPEHREVIVLARIERLRIAEIAVRMHRSPDAVKQLLVRALRRLKESFGDTESLGLPPRRLGGDERGRR